MDYAHLYRAGVDGLPVLERYVGFRLGIHVQTEETALHRGCLKKRRVEAVYGDGRAGNGLYLGVSPYVVEMPVRVYDVLDVEPAPFNFVGYHLCISSGVNDKSGKRLLVPHHVAIHVQRADDKP